LRVDLVDSSPCKIEPVGAMIFGKWTSHLLWSLAHYGPLRFGIAEVELAREQFDSQFAQVGSPS
jgi:DNA-binding HxlR family transcriptional regulator